MNKRANEIKRRLAERKRMKLQRIARNEKPSKPINADRKSLNDGIHPLFNKDLFLMKMLAAAILFLIVGILFKNESPQYTETRAFVNGVFEKDFQFATVAQWYEEKFGMPLALLPTTDEDNNGDKVTDAKDMGYAIPATGHVSQPFTSDGRGLMIETNENSEVKVVKDGFVSFIGDRNDIGKTVIIDHPGGGQTWYGMLDTVELHLYNYVKTGTVVGLASKGKGEVKGEFYFAIKQEDTFIDPIQVIKFE